MASTSKIEIKKDALENNIRFVESLLEPETRLSAVIKGNAYGHGVNVIIPAFESLGIDHFHVYSSAEAKAAFPHKSKKSTLVIMGFVYQHDYAWIIENNVEFYISHIHILQMAIEAAQKCNKKARIHLNLETGMNRDGISVRNLKKVAKLINENKDHVTVIGTTTHFAGAESIANHTRVRKQFSTYKKRIKQLYSLGINPGIKNVASSAATINYPETRLDMVRVGILLYGYWPSRETFIHYIHRRKDKSDPLRRAIMWYTEVNLIKKVPEGEFIGYGMSFQAQHNMITMLAPVGYCNGYSRSLSNNGRVIVGGQLAPVIGTVNMNMIICDITNIENVKFGDQVVLIGKQDENEISFASFADMNNSLNYEILARLPENIDRTICEEVEET
ncbi:MAG: alanine racemase [Marinilabiliales bacterium]|nr:MAG: alanine racemase [Marinilabiliales bacterium]